MSRILISASLLGTLLFATASRPMQHQQNWCGTAEKQEWLKMRVTQIFPRRDSLRAAAGYPRARSSEAPVRGVEIRDQAICEKATRAYYRNELGPYPGDGVAVMRYGDEYAVYGDIHGGEWTILAIYNLNFEPIDGYWS